MEPVNALFDLVQKYGLLAVVVVFVLFIALLVSRTWTKAKDARTAKETNYNKANELIMDKFVEHDKELGDLRRDRASDRETIARLEGELQTALSDLDQLRAQVILLQSDKTQISGQRDQLRADLDKANESIRELERQVSRLEGELQATRALDATVIQPLIAALRESTPVAHTGNTDKLPPLPEGLPDPSTATPPIQEM